MGTDEFWEAEWHRATPSASIGTLWASVRRCAVGEVPYAVRACSSTAARGGRGVFIYNATEAPGAPGCGEPLQAIAGTDGHRTDTGDEEAAAVAEIVGRIVAEQGEVVAVYRAALFEPADAVTVYNLVSE